MKKSDEREVKRLKFKDQVDFFLEDKKCFLADGTILNYQRDLNRACAVFGDIFIDDISYLEIKKYFVDLQNNGINMYTGKRLKSGTIMQHYITLHSFFENAVENGILTENPMRRLKRPKSRKDEELKPVISYDEKQVHYILSCLNLEPLKWKALIMVAIDSGCRCGELMGLKWTDIDFESGRMNIVRNIQYTPEKGIFVCTPKNGKSREIYLNGPVIAILKEWKKISNIGKTEKSNEYCFTGRNNQPMMPGCFNAFLRRFGKKYNLKGIHPHALRHSMASISLVHGADIVSVSKKLGHSNVSITLNVYSHTNFEAQLRANEVFAGAVYNKE